MNIHTEEYLYGAKYPFPVPPNLTMLGNKKLISLGNMLQIQC